ncbi:MAG: DNA-directed RNA polymerase subunit K [Nitrososphaeraceae archaeon]
MVVKQSPAESPAPKKPADHKEKSTKKSSTKTKSSSTKVRDSQSAVAEQSQSESKKKVRRSEQKEKSVTKRSKAVSGEVIVESVPEQEQVDLDQATKKVTRPEDEVVTYTEFEFDLKEIPPEGDKILIGPSRLTRFEKARITGARALQLSLGAPSLISVSPDIRDSISLAIAEIESKALPISIRRVLPNGLYQDIPIDWMKV